MRLGAPRDPIKDLPDVRVSVANCYFSTEPNGVRTHLEDHFGLSVFFKDARSTGSP